MALIIKAVCNEPIKDAEITDTIKKKRETFLKNLVVSIINFTSISIFSAYPYDP
jgi:hypothetical protein